MLGPSQTEKPTGKCFASSITGPSQVLWEETQCLEMVLPLSCPYSTAAPSFEVLCPICTKSLFPVPHLQPLAEGSLNWAQAGRPAGSRSWPSAGLPSPPVVSVCIVIVTAKAWTFSFPLLGQIPSKAQHPDGEPGVLLSHVGLSWNHSLKSIGDHDREDESSVRIADPPLPTALSSLHMSPPAMSACAAFLSDDSI